MWAHVRKIWSSVLVEMLCFLICCTSNKFFHEQRSFYKIYFYIFSTSFSFPVQNYFGYQLYIPKSMWNGKIDQMLQCCRCMSSLTSKKVCLGRYVFKSLTILLFSLYLSLRIPWLVRRVWVQFWWVRDVDGGVHCHAFKANGSSQSLHRKITNYETLSHAIKWNFRMCLWFWCKSVRWFIYFRGKRFLQTLMHLTLTVL